MLSAKFILAAFSTFVAVSAAPGADVLGHPSEQASPTITVCTDINLTGGCDTLPVLGDRCINLSNEFNKEVLSAKVPAGFICIFFEAASCLNADNIAILVGPTTYRDLRRAPGRHGTIDLNDRANSLNCNFL
ncbi:hypothetical protein C8J56DRAFT_1086075 [Mycena floridula]|nr:hypothetical protein C8J56DRAFT_1086075 [Mycena floridula]